MSRPEMRTVDPVLGPEELTFEPEPIPAAEALKDRISTWLSTLSMLAVSTGIGWGLWTRGLSEGHGGPWGAYALIPAGAFLAFMVAISDAGRRPEAVTVERPGRQPVPGPSHPGNLHAKGPGATA